MTTREIKNMGKVKKMKVSKSGGESDIYQPLTEQILKFGKSNQTGKRQCERVYVLRNTFKGECQFICG
jgi:hypothetical protein